MSELSALILAVGWVVGCWVLRRPTSGEPAAEGGAVEVGSGSAISLPTSSDDEDLTEFQHWLEEGGYAFSQDVQLQVEWAFGRLVGRDAEQGSEELAREILTRWASPGS